MLKFLWSRKLYILAGLVIGTLIAVMVRLGNPEAAGFAPS
jgi:hypothetical protein